MTVQQRQPFIIDIVALASFLVLVLVTFWKSVLGRGVIGSFDLVTLFYPYKTYVRELIGQGELPLWNPLVQLGVPLLGNIQTAILYPLNLLFVALPFHTALTWSVVLHIWLALAGTYLFLRYGLDTSIFAAWVGALCFGVGGFLLPHIGHLNQVHTAIWLPWLLLCARRACAPSTTWLLLGGIVTALSFTAGHTQEFYYSFVAVGLFCLYVGITSNGDQSSRWWPLVVPMLFVAIGGLLSTVQLLPTLEAVAQSYRVGGIPLQEAAMHALNRNDVLLFLLPNYWSMPPNLETSGYIGVSGGVLAFFAALQVTKHRWVPFFLALTVLTLVLAMGTYTPLFGFLHQILPGFASFRVAGRWLFLFSFGISVLAALGADRLRDDLRPGERRHLSLVFLTSTMVGMVLLVAFIGRTYLVSSHQTLPEPKVVVFWAIIAVISYATIILVLNHGLANTLTYSILGTLVMFELFFASRPLEFNQVMPREIYAPAPETEQLSQHWQENRFISIAEEKFPLENEEARQAELLSTLPAQWADAAMQYLRYGDELRANLNLPLGIASADGYDGGILPTRNYVRLRTALLNDSDLTPHFSLPEVEVKELDATLWGLLNVRYLIADHWQGEQGPGWEFVGRFREDGPYLFENNEVLPRAFVVYETIVDDDPLRLRDIDVARQAQVERLIPELVGTTGEPAPATVVAESPRRVEILASTPQPGLLVLSDAYYPGWTATINGNPAEIYRVNTALRGVLLPSGEHTVVFQYAPRWFQIGVVVSLGSWLLVLALLLPRVLSSGPKRF
jgi:hypothetical protein